MNHLRTDNGVVLSWTGPPLEQGPLPAFFYFALTADESLSLPPFDTPIKELSSIRCFSLTIPFHGPEYDPKKMVSLLGEAIANGEDPITPFIDQCVEAVDFVAPFCTTISAGGVSRGGFVALHLAARHPKVKKILAFAPVVNLGHLSGYDPADPLVKSLSPISFISKLIDKEIRIYIGNCDSSVGTAEVFHFVEKIVELSYEKGARIAPVELFITHSIGYRGHGTSNNSFIEGARWILLEI